jgi:hypothetical protein
MEDETHRSPVLTTFAVLFTLLALSNIWKPLSGGRAGFVFFGTKTAGVANAILGPAFGIFLLIYALGIWRRKRWALPMAWVYAAYVPINLTLFTIKPPERWQQSLLSVLPTSLSRSASHGVVRFC